jgi:CRP/FNR family cyclic AMP-dependent transcriptional regulator
MNPATIFRLPPLYKDALENFLSFCQIKKYPAKTTIIHAGEVGDRLYFILKGSVSVCAEDAQTGHKLILAYLNRNEFIGEIGVFKANLARTVSVITRGECYLAELTYERFHQLLHSELLTYKTDILYLLNEQLSARLLNTSRNVSDLAFMDVKGRIVRILLDLCKSPEAMTHPQGMQLHITRQEISRIVSCSKEVVGRVLKDMEKNKLIAARGKTIVVFGTR